MCFLLDDRDRGIALAEIQEAHSVLASSNKVSAVAEKFILMNCYDPAATKVQREKNEGCQVSNFWNPDSL
ncbi:hypothetical protein H6F43_16985 [Leptolyngbya sp. FACHB-36]|uniref:hypothetical protein n=1 Tax=Leptolyngbya sp. FACHB-36 TaxID=2692808 RepID=UPI0016819438|nr:hypothetical protein [Leptolyngbya sp. FACHB-36]MBD2021878.1 hypothetical protein [Leptolyngbya sp. FACHB-36]